MKELYLTKTYCDEIRKNIPKSLTKEREVFEEFFLFAKNKKIRNRCTRHEKEMLEFHLELESFLFIYFIHIMSKNETKNKIESPERLKEFSDFVSNYLFGLKRLKETNRNLEDKIFYKKTEALSELLRKTAVDFNIYESFQKMTKYLKKEESVKEEVDEHLIQRKKVSEAILFIVNRTLRDLDFKAIAYFSNLDIETVEKIVKEFNEEIKIYKKVEKHLMENGIYGDTNREIYISKFKKLTSFKYFDEGFISSEFLKSKKPE